MGLQLSNGVIATEVCLFSFLDTRYNTLTYNCAFVKNEEVWEWDLHAVYQEYITQGNNTWHYWIAGYQGDGGFIRYGLEFTRLNDVITVYECNSSSASFNNELFSFPYNSPPTNFKICVLYNISDYYGNAPYYRFFISHNYSKIVTTSVDYLPAAYGSDPGIYGVFLNTNRDLTSFAVTGPVHLLNHGAAITDESLFVNFVGEQPCYSTAILTNGFFPGIGELRDAGNDPVTPVTPPSPDEPPFNPPDPNPYNPSDDDSSDPIIIPGNPIIGVTSAGFINVYKTEINALQGLGDILFPNVASATDIVDAVIKLCETMANQNLINYVVDCHVIPVTPVVGANANIKVGFRDTGISAAKVTNDYVDATCGSLNIAEYFSGYQDYLYTRSKLYLPFIGFVDVKPEFWQAGTISVDYKFNVIDGSFMSYIRSTSSKSQLSNTIVAQYAGNACMHLPITGANYSAMVSGIIGAAITAAAGGAATSVLGGSSSIANIISQGPSVQQSNGYNSTAALMGVRTPYLMIERPVPSIPSTYPHSKGYPTNIAANLASISGYTVIEDIDLSGIPLTEAEINELRALLKEGVYF